MSTSGFQEHLHANGKYTQGQKHIYKNKNEFKKKIQKTKEFGVWVREVQDKPTLLTSS